MRARAAHGRFWCPPSGSNHGVAMPLTVTQPEVDVARALYEDLAATLGHVIRGQHGAIRKLLAAFAAGGHVLIEDVPGTGKTTLAKALARALDAEFRRIQFTPDLLPADVVGVSVYNQREQRFEFHRGPVFADVLLADEINRASPRTQSALLEAMAEGQVSVDGVRHPLGRGFFVIATQNPIESQGTYPLPEAQMDRFAMRFGLGYVGPEEEVGILSDQRLGHPLDAMTARLDGEQCAALRGAVGEVRVVDAIKRYIVDLCAATRVAEGVRIGASPRASLAIMRCAQALAAFDGQDFVSPDQVQEIAVPVIAHRLVMDPQARFDGLSAEHVVCAVLDQVPVPV